MTSRFSILLASTALALSFGLPTLAAMPARGDAAQQCSGFCPAVQSAEHMSAPLIRVSDDDHDEEDRGKCMRGGRDDDDDDDDDDDCTGSLSNPAPAGTVAPPANGLFGNGVPPVAVTN